MPIKRIQLKGIARTPSDKLADEGWCAESMNVQLETQEIAPSPVPEDLTADEECWENYGLPPSSEGLVYDIVFMHVGNGYKKFICTKAASAGTTSVGVWTMEDDDYVFSAFLTLPSGESIINMTSIGNTIVILTNENTYYALLKDGVYKGLGSTIPVPNVDFICDADQREMQAVLMTDVSEQALALERISATQYNSLYNSYYGTDRKVQVTYPTTQSTSTIEVHVTAAVNEMAQAVWNGINLLTQTLRTHGKFSRPFFIRYALKLYDGSYIYHSAPYLMGNNVLGAPEAYSDAYGYGEIDVHLNAFYAKVKVHMRNEYDNWKDIVQSIDIFMSTGVILPVDGAPFASKSGYIWSFKIEKSLEEELLSKSNFYLVGSIGIDELIYDTPYELELEPKSEDDLVVSQKMTFDFRSGHNPSPLTDLVTYNERLVAIGMRQRLSRNFPHLLSAITKVLTTDPENTVGYRFKYYIHNDEDIKSYSVLSHNASAGDEDDETLFPEVYYDFELEEWTVITPYPFIMYPDARCYQVDIQVVDGTESTTYRVPMKEHPNLDCAYFFADKLDANVSLKNFLESSSAIKTATWSGDEDRQVVTENTIVQFESANPFYVPMEGWHKFSGKVLGAYMTTVALSAGQFGQFPLYVFCDDGIFALETAANGTFSAHRPVSRDVALKGSVCPIDQSIVFTTAREVRMLTGSQVQSISAVMSGPHYNLEDAAEDVIEDSPWAVFLSAIGGSESFIAFMSGAKVMYDYPGARLIAFNPAYPSYQYVYKFDTGMWHKHCIYSGSSYQPIVRMLNSYPEALAQVSSPGQTPRLLNFSAAPSYASTISSKGVVITRPLYLDNPDVRKVIRNLRARGKFSNGRTTKAVNFILLASMDGLSWYQLTSLNSGSHKYYRLVIMTDMLPSERLSWVDVEYETRFTNKIR